MKFKVGDIVRPTREFIINAIENNIIEHLEYINGFQVLEIKDDRVFYYINEKNAFYKAEHLELVPEEPEFEYGEAIEVKIDEGFPWVERPFIYFAKGNAIHPYIMANINKAQFDAGKKFDFQAFRYARKLRPQLTRKEIAEKFGVSEDFILVE